MISSRSPTSADPILMRIRLTSCELGHDRSAAGRLAPDRHLVLVAPERADILLEPVERFALVLEAEVQDARLGGGLSSREAKRGDTVAAGNGRRSAFSIPAPAQRMPSRGGVLIDDALDGREDDGLANLDGAPDEVRPVVARIVGGALDETAAEDPHEHREPVGLGCPSGANNIDVQAVL